MLDSNPGTVPCEKGIHINVPVETGSALKVFCDRSRLARGPGRRDIVSEVLQVYEPQWRCGLMRSSFTKLARNALKRMQCRQGRVKQGQPYSSRAKIR
jgi:hypothetical protein